ncbi:MAG: hypothetical protein RIK87_06210 [Fuerstiella sp.]
MKSLMIAGVATAAMVLGGASANAQCGYGGYYGGSAFRGSGLSIGYGSFSPRSSFSIGYSSFPSYGYRSYGRSIRGRGHYDYHPPSIYPHRNHYHYVPGHWDYHRGRHHGHR